MRVVFRADASIQLGSGHVMRCLALADSLIRAGASVEFICRRAPGDLVDHISQQRGIEVHEATHSNVLTDADTSTQALLRGEKPDWLVVDHYELAASWQQQVRPYVGKIMAIDDLASRHHDCDLLLDQNLQDDERAYDSLVTRDCIKLLGPSYALLRSEFAAARATVRRHVGPVRRVLISFGGTDPTNETAKVLAQLRTSHFAERFRIDCVIGNNHPELAEVQALAARMPTVDLHVQSSNMAMLMASADVCFGAGGSTMWERCCMGLPTLAVAVADNQVPFGSRMHRLGYSYYLGDPREAEIDYVGALRRALDEPNSLQEMSRRGMELVDGKGAERVAARMLELC